MTKQDVQSPDTASRLAGAVIAKKEEDSIVDALSRVSRPFGLHNDSGWYRLTPAGPAGESTDRSIHVPACLPWNLGDPTFLADHGLRYPYIAGAMANAGAAMFMSKSTSTYASVKPVTLVTRGS